MGQMTTTLGLPPGREPVKGQRVPLNGGRGMDIAGAEKLCIEGYRSWEKLFY